jgi:hypothetical protein
MNTWVVCGKHRGMVLWRPRSCCWNCLKIFIRSSITTLPNHDFFKAVIEMLEASFKIFQTVGFLKILIKDF